MAEKRGKKSEESGRRARLAQEFAAHLNKDVSFEELKPHSHRRVWWRCGTCGHEWQNTVDNRSSGSNCPACAGRVVTASNCLAARRSDVAMRWDYEKNGDLTPRDVAVQSHRKAYFRCQAGHSYARPIYHMVNRGGCKYCAGQAATTFENLAARRRDLAAEWHPTKNGHLGPDGVTERSSRRVWWMCKKGHEWQTTPDKRTSRGDGCPFCWTPASRLQIRVYTELNAIFGGAAFDALVAGKHIDVWFPALAIAVEVDGEFWHRSRLRQDEAKYCAIRDAGIRLIRLRDVRLPEVGADVTISYASAIHRAHIEQLALAICDEASSVAASTRAAVDEYLRGEEYVATAEFQRLCVKRTKPPKKRSLAFHSPHIAREWDYEANAPLKPTDVYAKAYHSAWFRCRTCGSSYATRISHRTDSGSGCPYCAGKAVSHEASLGSRHPALMAEWHPTRNQHLDPFAIAPLSNKPVWWICPHGHEYSAPPGRRVGEFKQSGRYSGCDRCYHGR